MIVVESAGISDVGKKRQGNEDSYFFNDDLGLYLVADGMGGHNAGEVASGMVAKIVTEQLQRFFSGKDADRVPENENMSPEARQLGAAIHMANHAIYEQAQKNQAQKGMGSTVSAVLLTEKTMIVANVGDSPIFLLRNNDMQTLSTPHTMMAEYEAIAPGSSKKLSDKFRHMITRAMGIEPEVKPDIMEMNCLEKDIVVICSDGLSDKVKPKEIQDIISEKTPAKSCKALVDLANERGGDDNITIIVINIEEFAKEQPDEKVEEEDDITIVREEAIAPLQVSIDTEDASLTAFIRDINVDSVFIETSHPFGQGKEIDITLADPDGSNAFMVVGHVAKRSSRGIMVTFNDVSDSQKEKILTLKRKL